MVCEQCHSKLVTMWITQCAAGGCADCVALLPLVAEAAANDYAAPEPVAVPAPVAAPEPVDDPVDPRYRKPRRRSSYPPQPSYWDTHAVPLEKVRTAPDNAAWEGGLWGRWKDLQRR
ncbi:MAG: hypothetical protein NVSMB29_19880 [Candidatus Dormibacteria bacterium]